MMLSDTELAEIKARVQAVSDSQWQSWIEGRDHECGSNFIMAFNSNGITKDIEILGATIEEQDFIVHAKQDMVKLLAEIERLKHLSDWDETAYLLSSPNNAKHLKESIEQARQSKIKKS